MQKEKSQPRATRDAVATRAKLLKAATQEFAGKGFDGARVNTVADAAGVNINLIYHYFQNKEGLFIAVMEDAYQTIRSHHNDIRLRVLEPKEAMAELVRSTFHLFADNPHIIGLLNSENLHEAKHIRQSTRIGELYNPLLEFISETLERGVQSGDFREGVDPVELFISINAEGYFYLANRHTLGFIMHQNLLDPARLAQREAHIVDVILSYLKRR